MGRPARNHGGTGGRGCLPFPGERPNFNNHVMSDKTLQNLVKNANQEPGRSTKIEILKYLPKYGEQPKRVHSDSESVPIMAPRRVTSDRLVDSLSMKVPKRVQIDRPRVPLSIKDHTHCDTPSLKKPKEFHCDNPLIKKPNGTVCDAPKDQKGNLSDTSSIKMTEGGQCETPSIKEPKGDIIKAQKEGQCDAPSIKRPKGGPCGTPSGSESISESKEDPHEILSIKELKDCPSETFNESPKEDHCDTPIIKELRGDCCDTPSHEKTNGVHCDNPTIKEHKGPHSETTNNKDQRGVLSDTSSIKVPEGGHCESPSIKESKGDPHEISSIKDGGHFGTPTGSVTVKDPSSKKPQGCHFTTPGGTPSFTSVETPMKSNQISGAFTKLPHSPVEMPVTSAQVNIYIIDKKCIPFFSFFLKPKHFGATSVWLLVDIILMLPFSFFLFPNSSTPTRSTAIFLQAVESCLLFSKSTH